MTFALLDLFGADHILRKKKESNGDFLGVISASANVFHCPFHFLRLPIAQHRDEVTPYQKNDATRFREGSGIS